MGQNNGYCSLIGPLLFFLLLLTSLTVSTTSASPFLSADTFGDPASIGRKLLQATTACPVNFEFLNYTIITSQCKGPHYPVKPCCSALIEFACPYAEQINDLSNNCATTMFSYINLYGKYPPGLFSSECHGNKQGLVCPATSPTASANENGNQIICNPSPLLVLTTSFLALLLQFF